MSINAIAENIVGKAFNNTLVSGLTATRVITIHAIARGGHSVSTGVNTGTPTDYVVNAIVMKVSLRDVSANQGILEIGDLRLLIGRQQTVPTGLTTDDEITLGTDKYSILLIEESNVGGTDLLWRCFVRRK